MYGQSRKDVFLTLLSVTSNFATLNLLAAVMQRETSTWVDFISLLRLSFPFIYIIRCTPFKGARSLHIYPRGGFRGYVYPGITMAVVYVYISTGVGRLLVAYPHEGAMRRPDDRDRRGEIHTPTSFLFP